ncbi:MAG: metallophosphoesterase family protein, partial [Planctomycetota bacterium]
LLRSRIPLTGVFGNNDGERAGIRQVCKTIYDPPHRFECGGRVIVLAHDPEELHEADAAGADVLVHGHTHQLALQQAAPLRVNPGEGGGWLTGKSSVALVDLDELKAEIVELGSQETVEI